jgi:hypothetical protein
MSNPIIKKPLNPLELNEWLTGVLYGNQRKKFQYVYCIHNDESLESIPIKLAGKQIVKDEPYCYEKEMNWEKLALFNYGTSDSAEINWYLSNFNGCRKTDSSGSNFILSSNDTNPYLWIPVSNKLFSGKTGTPLKIVLDTPDIITNTFFEDGNGKRIDNIGKEKQVYLIVETRNSIGNKFDIDLSDMKRVFEYDGNRLEENILQNVEITLDKMKFKLDIK